MSVINWSTVGSGLDFGELDRGLDRVVDAALERGDLVGSHDAALDRDALGALDRILLAPAVDLFLLAVVQRVAGVVAVEAVGVADQVGRPLAAAGPLDQLVGGGVDGEQVHAVDGHARDAVARRASGRVAAGDAPVGARRHGVLVVLAHVHHRQLPDRGQVRRLVQDALLERAVAEEADRDRAGVLELRGQRRAGRQAHAAADDAVGAEHVLVHVGDVHAAALAARVAGGAAEQLGHHALDVAALGDGVAVAAVGAGDVVVRAAAPR